MDDILHGFDQDKVEAKSLNGYLQESIMKLKVEERQLRRKTTSTHAKSKEVRAKHAEMMQTASAKIVSNPSIDELGMLVSEGRCKEDVLLECNVKSQTHMHSFFFNQFQWSVGLFFHVGCGLVSSPHNI